MNALLNSFVIMEMSKVLAGDCFYHWCKSGVSHFLEKEPTYVGCTGCIENTWSRLSCRTAVPNFSCLAPWPAGGMCRVFVLTHQAPLRWVAGTCTCAWSSTCTSGGCLSRGSWGGLLVLGTKLHSRAQRALTGETPFTWVELLHQHKCPQLAQVELVECERLPIFSRARIRTGSEQAAAWGLGTPAVGNLVPGCISFKGQKQHITWSLLVINREFSVLELCAHSGSPLPIRGLLFWIICSFKIIFRTTSLH